MNSTACTIGDSWPEYSIRELAKFHGHLGPYVVLGYRVGRYARAFFSGSREISAAAYCSDLPPESCFADGIQIGSGCTFGRRRIELKKSGRLGCIFRCGEETLAIRAHKPELPEISKTDYWEEIRGIAEAMYAAPDDRLFTEDPDFADLELQGDVL
ncbi:formylmethanofuran dehydrogenase [Methanofollis aquaemaris]|uniref:Formylmethanofuran dehydrogenase n=1 Tax=Methanofollis aquaemaris TaxID=126734 RepID=A0A8A3S987_9EURY|nr:formylmethanofuran dehydrogenase subunit E family protein [Methanofollis aquaemaris]QSZ68180.1 formylmethanofuran dehydrogenase [Methanofollis aquaemaris]